VLLRPIMPPDPSEQEFVTGGGCVRAAAAAAIFSLIACRPQPSLSLRPQTTLNYLSLSPDVRMPAAPRYHNAC
jgi:hypothetical protein